MRSLRHLGMLAVFAGLGCGAAVSHAQLDARGEREVAALLNFVGDSHCTFIRNGKAYGAADARSHLQYKLNYLLKANEVASAEDFIAKAATESSMSGKPYRVDCDGVERLSADWLGEELRHLREAQP